MSKVYKVGDVFYDKGLNCYVKAVASDSRYCDGNKCALHTSDCTTTIDNCIGIRFIKVPAPKPQSAVTKEPSDKTVESIKVNVNPPKLAMSNDTILQYRKETSWGVNPSIGDKVNPLREKNPIMSNNPNQTYSFEIKLNNGLRFVAPMVTLSTVALDCKITAATLPSTERFIVCLLENGKLAPSDSPKIHATREKAEKEAERLCRLHNQEFVVLKVTASFKPQQPKKEVFA